MPGEDGFGMELHALDGQFAMAKAHDLVTLAIQFGPGGFFQHIRQ